MAISVHRMLAFSDALQDKWWPAMRAAPAELLVSPVDFSFMTPLGIMTHIANIENYYNDALEGEKMMVARHSTKEWGELVPVEAYWRAARSRTHKNVDGLSETDLLRQIPIEVEGFAKKDFTVQDLVFTIFTHEQWHRGEVLAAFWSKNVEPPKVDYPRYATPLGRPAMG
ncbi:MAG: DinB family protein [Euryarchaeota archaeon]|nr:DinB family protein [Euryarchaeota archaeon]